MVKKVALLKLKHLEIQNLEIRDLKIWNIEIRDLKIRDFSWLHKFCILEIGIWKLDILEIQDLEFQELKFWILWFGTFKLGISYPIDHHNNSWSTVQRFEKKTKPNLFQPLKELAQHQKSVHVKMVVSAVKMNQVN